MSPLEIGFEHAPDAPVGVTQVIVDGRVFRLELDRLFQVLDRFLVVAEAVVRPAK